MSEGYFLNRSDLTKLRRVIDENSGRQRIFSHRGRRRRGTPGRPGTSTSSGGGGRVKIVLIDAADIIVEDEPDVPGVIEDDVDEDTSNLKEEYISLTDEETSLGLTVKFEEPSGTEVPYLWLMGFRPTALSVKYFRQAVASDPNYDEYNLKFVLETEEDGDNYDEFKIIRYKTMTVYYLDGRDIFLQEYNQADYPDYPNDEAFPPDGTGTFEELPEGFLRKKFRALAFPDSANRYWLDLRTCKPLPAPRLPERIS